MQDLPSAPAAPSVPPLPAIAPAKPGRASKAQPLDAPSVRAVREVLANGKRMTAADLRDASALPRRTIYRALQVLREGGLLHERGSLQDSRQTYFWLADAAAAAAGFGHAGHLGTTDKASPASAGL